ncbi:MAG: deoxyribose-phosphate aldolase [Anaerolineae bacterium]|nr:MAG: deoxyribose-phosphate aldolase [Anaerolineae bacterium]
MINLKQLLAQAETYEHKLPPLPATLTAPAGPAFASWIDHTLLKPEATAEQIKALCAEAREHRFATVCINPAYVPLAAGLLRDTRVGVCTVISFPLGAHLPAQKAAEARQVIDSGATEIDMVMNIGAMKSGAYELVYEDIKAVAEVCHQSKVQLKVILEMCYLTQREKILACLLSKQAGADFIKTSTGFGPSGATVEDVALMRRLVGTEVGVKAAGGIRTFKDALAMIGAGANRLGTSVGVAILQEARTSL